MLNHFPREFFPKIARGLNVYQHIRDIWGTRSILKAQAGMVLAGGIFAIWCLDFIGVFNRLFSLITQGMSSPMSTMLHGSSLASFFYTPILVLFYAYFARDMFTMKARGDWQPILPFVWSFIRATFFEVVMLLPVSIAMFVARFLMFSVQDAPSFTLGVFAYYAGSFLAFAVGLFLLRYALSFVSFSFVYLLQGKSFSEAWTKGLRMFDSHWPFIVMVLIVSHVVLTFILSFALTYLLQLGIALPHALLSMLTSPLSYMYYFIVLTVYHKRVVKFPGK